MEGRLAAAVGRSGLGGVGLDAAGAQQHLDRTVGAVFAKARSDSAKRSAHQIHTVEDEPRARILVRTKLQKSCAS